MGKLRERMQAVARKQRRIKAMAKYWRSNPSRGHKEYSTRVLDGNFFERHTWLPENLTSAPRTVVKFKSQRTIAA
jgi:hypothetical protein